MTDKLPDTPRWRPARALKLSAVLHAATAAAVVATPEGWAMGLSVLAANHLALAGAGLAPRSTALGPNLTRLPDAARARGEVALTFDDGPDPTLTPQVLDALDRHGARATFFCVGERARACPSLVREMVDRGHRVENHTQRHPTAFGWYGLAQLRREIAEAQDTLGAITGTPPRFFRAPFGMRNPLLDPALAAAGLRLVSWTRRGYDTVDARTERVLERLTRGLAGGDILVLHDGVATGRRATAPATLAVLPRLLDGLASRGLRPVTLHEACVVGA